MIPTERPAIRLRWAVLWLAALSQAAALPVLAQAAPSLTVSPLSGPPGATVVARGAGFAPNARGFVAFGGQRVGKVRAGRRGRFVLRFAAPAQPAGRRALLAVLRPRPGVATQHATSVFTLKAASTGTHVVWIVMENHRYEQVIGSSSAPYVNQLADTFGLATKYTALSHPSLPNYIAMTSGQIPSGLGDDGPPSSHPLAIPSIFGQLKGDWRALQESMPSHCALSGQGNYAPRHNPAAYYTPLRSLCATRDVPLSATPDLGARFTFVTPNLCNDTHDCSVATGDTWLKGFIEKVLKSPEYTSGQTVVFLTWDESDGTAANHIPTIVISPTTSKIKNATPFNHYSLLRTTEELLGLSPLGKAATAASMRTAFHL